MINNNIIIGITQGDTNGIGYEVIMKALEDEEMLQLCTPVIYGSPKVLSYHRKAIDMQHFSPVIARNASSIKTGAINMIECMNGEEVKIEFGEPSKIAGKAAFAALEAAVADLNEHRIDALVTAPINKDNIQSESFNFNGHTEYLQASCGDGNQALMILFDEHVRVALVTTHLPISQVAQAITAETIITRLHTFDASLRRDFGVERPRIAVLSLNPHAGENGLLGSEEKDIIAPAIAQAYDDHIMCFGPYPADSFFAMEQYRHFDGVLAMYHDQGLAPFKTIARG